MNMTWVRGVAKIVILGLALAVPALAEDKLTVKVGASADAAAEAKATDITVDKLKAAKDAKDATAFSVTGADGAAHTLSLSAKEAGDILGGTTVTADAGGVKVWISLAAEKTAAPAPAEGGSSGGGW